MRIEISGVRVLSIEQDFQVRILFSQSAVLAIEVPFSLADAAGHVHEVRPGEMGFADESLDSLLEATVNTAEVEAGLLTLEFVDGRSIVVVPSADYEAWTLDSPGRSPSKIVATPGGGTEIW
jgi:hypothetical protein